MKTTSLCMLFISFLFCFNSNAQNNVRPSYKVTLSEKTYILKNQELQSNGMKISMNSCTIKLLETELGVTGIVGTGLGTISITGDKEGHQLNDSVISIFLRFNPKELNQLIDLEKAEISQSSKVPTEIYEFYTEVFSQWYHAGPKAFIPEKGVMCLTARTTSYELIRFYFDGKSKALTLNPKTPKELNKINYYYNTRKFDKAFALTSLFIGKYSDNIELNMIHGRVMVDLGKFKDAIPYLLKAIDLEKKPTWISAWSYAYLGIAYYQTGDMQQSEKVLKNCIDINSTSNVNAFANNLLIKYGFRK